MILPDKVKGKRSDEMMRHGFKTGLNVAIEKAVRLQTSKKKVAWLKD